MVFWVMVSVQALLIGYSNGFTEAILYKSSNSSFVVSPTTFVSFTTSYVLYSLEYPILLLSKTL